MAAEVFGGRVKDQVCAFFKRALKDGAEVGVVHHDHDTVVFGAVLRRPFRGLADALNLHRGVGGGLEVDNAGALTAQVFQGGVQLVEVVDLRHRASHGRHDFFEEVVGAAVQRSDKPHGAVGSGPCKQGRGNGGHAAAKQRRVVAVVPRGEPLLRHADRGVAQSAVNEPVGRGLCAFNAVGGFHVGGAGARVRKDEGGSGVHGGLHSHVGVRRTVPCEHCAGLEVLVHVDKFR